MCAATASRMSAPPCFFAPDAQTVTAAPAACTVFERVPATNARTLPQGQGQAPVATFFRASYINFGACMIPSSVTLPYTTTLLTRVPSLEIVVDWDAPPLFDGRPGGDRARRHRAAMTKVITLIE